MAYIYDLIDTWNNAGTTFTAIKMNVTDTNSSASSLLMDLQVGGVSQAYILKNGTSFFGAIRTSPIYGYSDTVSARTDATANRNLAFTGVGLQLRTGGHFGFTSGDAAGTADTYLTRRGGANLRLGATDAAAPVAQKLSVQSVIAGTTNAAGADWTFTGSQGTGTGAGGSIIFQVAPAGSTGSTQNALQSALTIIPASVAGQSSASLMIKNDGNGPFLFNSTNGAITLGPSYGTIGLYVENGRVSIGGYDIFLARDAASILAQRYTTNAQTYRLYGTYTDASNYERGYLTTDSNGFTIGTEALGTGTKRPVRIIGPSLASAEAVSILELSQTWNTSGTPTGLKLNVTDTASNAASLLMDLQVGGASRFQVTKAGSALFRAGAGASFYRSSDDGLVGTISAVSATGSIDISGGFKFAITSGDTGTFYLSGTNRAIQFGMSDGDGSIRRRAASNIQLGPADVGAVTATVTITIATPGVVTWSNHNLSTGTPVVFTTTGALPTGITAGTTYYAVFVTTSTFQIASSVANAIAATPTVITTSGSQSGTHTGTRYNITQRLSMQSITGVTDRLGADLFIQGSQGTGTGAGGSIIFQVAPAGGTGTAQNVLATALTLNSDKTSSFGGDIIGPQAAFAIKTYSTTSFEVWLGSTRAFQVNYNTGVRIANYMGLGWTSGTDVNTTPDLQLFRDAAYILAQRYSTNAQTYRLYGTYTDASNYERGYLTTDSNGFTIGTEALGTGTKRPVRIIGPSLASAESVSILELSQTWNTSGTPTGLKLNVTDTASNAASLLMDLGTGGGTYVSQFRVGKNGSFGGRDPVFGNFTISCAQARIQFSPAAAGGAIQTSINFVGTVSTVTGFSIGAEDPANADTRLTRRGPANLRLGVADAAGSAISISSVATNQLTLASSHGLSDGAAVQITFTAGGAVPAGTAVNTTYYARSISAAVLELYGTYDQAITTASTTGRVAVTTAGTTAFVNRATPFQTLSVQSFTGTDIPGQPFVITGSQGTGTGGGGDIIFQVAPRGTTGSAQNALATALRINSFRQLLAIDGSPSRPAFSFATDESTGLYLSGANLIFSYAGAARSAFSIRSGIVGFTVPNTGAFVFSSTSSPIDSGDLFLYRDAANTLALRNGNEGQTFRLYGRFTDITNDFERFFINAPTTSGAAVLLGTQKGATTGAARALELQTDGTTRLAIDTAGRITISNGVIGNAASGSGAIIKFGTTAPVPVVSFRNAGDTGGAEVNAERVTVAAAAYVYWNGRSSIYSPADGNLQLTNFAANGFDRLQFGGTTSSFPALKRSSASLQVRLADDSANAALESASIKTDAPAGGTAATWKLGTVASVSPTSPNRTIEVDIGGTIYYLHAKTTND